MGAWESNEVEHTFSTGRTMTIRRALSLQHLVLRAVESDDPELANGLEEWFTTGRVPIDDEESPTVKAAQLQLAVRMQRTIIETMFLRPRVHWDEDEVPVSPPPPDGEPPYHLAAADLRDGEISEVLEIALQGVADASTFRGDEDGPKSGAGGKGVGTKPKPRPRAAAGKR